MDTITFLLIAPTLLFIFFLLRPHRRPSQPPLNLPPSPKGLPVIGHLHLVTDMPHHAFTDISRRLGPIFHLRLGQVPTVVVNSAQLAKLVMKTHDHVFSNRPQLISAQYLSFGCSDVTFSPYGPYWRQARKVCVSELLSARRVNSFRLVRDVEVDRAMKSVAAHSGRELDLSQVFFNLANDVLCRVAFGRRFVDEEGSRGDLVHVLTETQELFAGFCLGDFFPEWGWVNSVSGYKRRLVRNLGQLRAVCDEIIAEHEGKMGNENVGDDGNTRDEDFVDVLLRIQRRHDLEVPITDDNLKALVLDMFVAGTDTSSATLEWTMTELARHPEVMSKAQKEVRNLVAGRRKVDEDDLRHLPYMRSVIKESMRLHPPVPLLVPRESMEKCVLEGYEIPPKTRVLVNAYAIGRDPNSWDRPLEFDPERFMASEVEFKDQDFRFLPFGGGRRGCPGYTFGLATIEIALARLLYHFDWELPDGVDGGGMDLGEIFGLATRKKSPLVLVPTARTEFGFMRSSRDTNLASGEFK
uniref:Tryptamine 5-hydrolase n=1 Tax=Hypericum kalmianum TaxID=473045 RepID=A0A224X464_9ROSI